TRPIADGAHDALRGGADRAPELLAQPGRLVDPARGYQRVVPADHAVDLARQYPAQPHGLEVVVGEDGLARVGGEAILRSGQLRDAAALDQVLEGADGLDLENGARDLLVGQVGQRYLLHHPDLRELLEGAAEVRDDRLLASVGDVRNHAEAKSPALGHLIAI